MIEALVFDFDGLTIDTETPIATAWEELFTSYNVPFPRQIFLDIVGTPKSFDPFPILTHETGRQFDEQAIYAQVRKRILELIDASPLRPGIQRTLDEAKALGLKLAVASSSPHRWVDHYLQERGIFHYFDAVRCLDDVKRGKPAPDLYLAALEAIHVAGAHAIALEDSAHGIHAAIQAGMYAVAIPNELTQHFNFDLATVRLNSLADVSLVELIEMVQGTQVSIVPESTSL